MSQPWLLPTPLVALLVRSVPVRGRQILAQHLRNPDYLRELTEEDRAEAARVLVQRLAQSGRAKATLRQRAVTDDIALPADFDFGTLSREARAAIHDALGRIGPDRLAGLTWGELLDKKRRAPPRHALLLALGELEWLVTQGSVPTLDRHRSDMVRARLGALLGDSRLDLVLANDFRLGWRRFGEAPRLGKLLAGWASAATLTAIQERYVERLTEVFAMSLADDISDIGRCLAQAAFTNRDARGRAAEVFAARFGVRPYGPALEAVGKRHGCSAGRVTQLEGILLDALGGFSLVSPAAITARRRIEMLSFAPIAQLEQSLGLTAGQGHSLPTFRRFCLKALVPPLAFDVSEQTSARQRVRGVAAPFDQASSFAAALRYARRQVRVSGAANLTTLAGSLALDSGHPVLRADLERLIDEHLGATWLSRDSGWFALDDFADSLIYGRVRKILAVAKLPITVHEIGAALWRSASYAEEAGAESELAPPPILKAAILAWPDGITEDARSRLALEPRPQLADLLSPQELEIYRVLAERGGVASSTTVRNVARGDPASLAAKLHNCIFVKPLGNRLFGLVGWDYGERELLAALSETMLQAVASEATRASGMGPKVIRLQ
jgi:hypothetical protein